MVKTDKKILIYDDTGRGPDYYATDILFENKEIIVCNVKQEGSRKNHSIIIYRKNGIVASEFLNFYYAKNSLVS